MTPLDLSLYGLAACLLGIVACVGWWRCERRAARYWQINVDDAETDIAVRSIALPLLGARAVNGDSYAVPPLEDITANLVKRTQDAELACETLRASLMQGSAVAVWTWAPGTRPPAADAHYQHIVTAHGDLLLTDEAFAIARYRAAQLLTPPT